MPIDMDSLLQPIAANAPAGPTLEYDGAFGELERTAQGRPDQQIGNSVVAGEPPDWAAVEKQATALLSRTKDLRIAIHLVRALLHRHGFVGWGAGLGLVRGMLERFWGSLHPQLDAEDPSDPIRVNTLSALADADTLATLRTSPLAQSRSFGRIALREIAVASGELAPTAGAPKVEEASIEAAFQECDLAELEATASVLGQSLEHLRVIETFVSENGGGNAPDFSAAIRLVRQAQQFVQPRIERRRPTEGVAGASADGAPVNGVGGAPLSGEIRSRDDVVRALDKICSYYERNEPSSPLPLLLQRCKRLAKMSFLEVIREIVPNGLSQVELIAGKQDEG